MRAHLLDFFLKIICLLAQKRNKPVDEADNSV